MNIRYSACRQAGFSLIELIVSIVIVMLVSGGALVYINKFNSRQKLEKGKDEVVATIKLVSNYAKGRQLPNGSNQNELKYVFLQMNNGFLEALANNDSGDKYFSDVVNANGITVTTEPSPIIFWAGGKLSHDIDLIKTDFYGEDEVATVIVTQSAEQNERYEIIIDALGQIKEVNYYEE